MNTLMKKVENIILEYQDAPLYKLYLRRNELVFFFGATTPPAPLPADEETFRLVDYRLELAIIDKMICQRRMDAEQRHSGVENMIDDSSPILKQMVINRKLGLSADSMGVPDEIEIIRRVAVHFNTDSTTILERRRSLPRKVAMYLIRKLTDLSLVQMATLFHCDHATVLNTLKRVAEDLQNGDRELENDIRQIVSDIMKS